MYVSLLNGSPQLLPSLLPVQTVLEMSQLYQMNRRTRGRVSISIRSRLVSKDVEFHCASVDMSKSLSRLVHLRKRPLESLKMNFRVKIPRESIQV